MPKFKKKKKVVRPSTPVFFENYAPPKKAKAATKKRFKSQAKEGTVNLLQSILHVHEPKAKKEAKSKNFGKKK